MFQGPKGYIAQISEVHLQYGNKIAVLHFFLVNSTLIYILFSLWLSMLWTHGLERNEGEVMS